MLPENGASEAKINLVPGSIRVACAANGGEQIDGHFLNHKARPGGPWSWAP